MEELAVAPTRALGFVTGLSSRSWLGLLVARLEQQVAEAMGKL